MPAGWSGAVCHARCHGPQLGAEPLDRAPGDRGGAGAVEFGVDLTDPVDSLTAMEVDGHDLFLQLGIAQRPGAGFPGLEGVVGLRGDLEVELLDEGPEDRFDPRN